MPSDLAETQEPYYVKEPETNHSDRGQLSGFQELEAENRGSSQMVQRM